MTGARFSPVSPNPFEAMRYHSLLVEPASIPNCLEVSARTAEGEIMGLRHKQLSRSRACSSIPNRSARQQGKELLRNFLAEAAA